MRVRFLAAGLLAMLPAGLVFADQHTTGVPELSSRPGAAYTIYLDPSGFNYDGTWSSSTPGITPSLNEVADNGTFGAADVAEINAIWAAMANQYRSFNVNVTTVDPAIAAGQSGTDIERRDYYDSQAHMMHTVIGKGDGWQGSADGLALLNTIGTVASNPGEHTNWMFTNAYDGTATVANGNYTGNISSHETGHTFGLNHQGDFTGTIPTATVVNEYGFGDDANGNGNYVATMGNASDRQRVAWRVGSTHNGDSQFVQNDVMTILANDGAAIADSGIGHTFATATAIPLAGSVIDVNNPLHRGVISPNSASNPDPIGVDNYTKDVFSFVTDGSNPISLILHDGDDFLTPGVADNGLTLRGALSIFDSSYSLVASAVEDSSTLFQTYTGLLGAGTYYAQITSFGGHEEVTNDYLAAQYYDMGGYFLTGSGFVAVPEPASIMLFAIGSIGLMARRRRAA